MIEKEGIVIKNKYEDIEILALDSTDELYDKIGENLFELNEDEYISIYGKRNLINELFKMMVMDDFDIEYVDYDMIDDSLEDTVYLMNIYQDASISVETAYGNNDVKDTDANTVFIFMNDCKQNIIDNCVNSDKDVVLFDFDSEYCDCCGKCDCNGSVTTKSNSSTVSKDDDGTLNGFSVSWADSNDGSFYSSSYSYYSNDENTVRRLAKEFGVNVD